MIDFSAERMKMIMHLRGSIKDERVIEAMSQIPRELFVPESERRFSYEDSALPIDCEQTISQPYIVAIMTQALCLTGNEKVLEIGTGSGYQAAILSRLAKKIITVERVPQLVDIAMLNLDKLKCTNVELHLAGEILGWRKESPYDTIMVTAAAPCLPAVLIDQLNVGGRLVIPIGSRYSQELWKVTKHESENEIEKLVDCQFVPLIGKEAWES